MMDVREEELRDAFEFGDQESILSLTDLIHQEAARLTWCPREEHQLRPLASWDGEHVVRGIVGEASHPGQGKRRRTLWLRAL